MGNCFFVPIETIDKNAAAWIALVHVVIRNDAKKPIDSKQVTIKVDKNQKRELVECLGLKFFADDGDSNDIFSDLKDDVVEHLDSLPHTDRDHLFASEREAIDGCLKTFNKVLPACTVQWSEWDSMHTQSEFAFSGLGQYFLTAVPSADSADRPAKVPTGAAYQIDLSDWYQYETRSNYARMGCISFYDADRQPCGIFWCEEQKLILPGDEQHPHVSLMFRTNVGIRMTVREHLGQVHWTVSNGLLLASERHLSKSHPIRRLIAPHTYGTANINKKSLSVLAPVSGLAYRTFGFGPKAWGRLLDDQISAFRLQTLEEHFVASGLPEQMRTALPLYHDGLQLWGIFQAYVQQYVDIHYPTENALQADAEIEGYWSDFGKQLPNQRYDVGKLTRANLVLQLTHSLFYVTALHNHVGSLVEYLNNPHAMTGALCKGAVAGSVQQSFYALCVVALTAVKMPDLMNDWTHLYDDLRGSDAATHQAVVRGLAKWQADLVTFSGIVDERNVARKSANRQIFTAMNPRAMDCSVSV